MMPAMDLNLIQVFCAVAEVKSFANAAKCLEISTASVSRKISELEKQVGRPLFFRSTRSVTLTGYGEQLFRMTAPLVLQLSHSAQRLTSDETDLEATVRITSPEDFGASVLAPLIADFCDEWPRIRVECLFTDRRIDLVSESIDIALRMGRTKGNELVFRRLGECEFDFVASTKYLARIGEKITAHNLREHVKVAFGLHGNHGPFQFPFPNALPARITGRSFATIYNLVKAGHGASFLPRFLVQDDCNRGLLEVVAPECRPAAVAANLVTLQTRRISPGAMKLVRYLQKHLPGKLNVCSVVSGHQTAEPLSVTRKQRRVRSPRLAVPQVAGGHEPQLDQ